MSKIQYCYHYETTRTMYSTFDVTKSSREETADVYRGGSNSNRGQYYLLLQPILNGSNGFHVDIKALRMSGDPGCLQNNTSRDGIFQQLNIKTL